MSKTMELAVEDKVAVRFSVIGNSDDNTLDFYIIYPNGTVKMIRPNVGNIDYDFTCDTEGEYTLRFDNSGSSIDKLVSLDYEAQHYIMGVPQMLFLTVLVAIICVAMVAVFVLSSRNH